VSVVVAEDDIGLPVALATEAGNLSVEAVIDLFVLIPTEVDIRWSVAVPGEVEIAWPVAVMIGSPVVVAFSEVAVAAKVVIEFNNGNGFCYRKCLKRSRLFYWGVLSTHISYISLLLRRLAGHVNLKI